MKVRTIDFESTGLPDKDKDVELVEVGWTDVDEDMVVHMPRSFLVNPGRPIPSYARAVHHISDEMVAEAVSPSEARHMLFDGMEPGDIFAAHNYLMESALFDASPLPWICTMICAKHLWEGEASYGNQALRYSLGLDREFLWPAMAMPPHRAGPDSYITAHILRRQAKEVGFTRLIELTSTPILLQYVQTGKYEGRLWSEMDRGYLEFYLDPTKGPFRQEVIDTARYWLRQLDAAKNPFA